MEQVGLVVLGAVLSIAGGFLAQERQLRLDLEREQTRVLLDVNQLLLQYRAACSVRHVDATAVDRELLDIRCRLSGLAIRLTVPRYLDVGVEVSRLALDESLWSQERVHELTREVQLLLNKKMIARYEATTPGRSPGIGKDR